MPLLGVNIDHVATVRQARREEDPDPVEAALLCEKAGADSIVAHLREDRRHIQDADILRLKKALSVRFNLEMSLAPSIVDIACRVKPDQVTLVPERRQELTTEGGLDIINNLQKLKYACRKLSDRQISISLFIDADRKQIEAAHMLGIRIIEIHTGCYALASNKKQMLKEWQKISDMTSLASKMGITVNAGHGLKYHNVGAIAQIPGMHELNIGHSIIARSILKGLENAVKEMIISMKKH